MVPGLRLLSEGAVTDQVTAEVTVPAISDDNCNWPPIIADAGLGNTVIAIKE
jgi:hypothetical protein